MAEQKADEYNNSKYLEIDFKNLNNQTLKNSRFFSKSLPNLSTDINLTESALQTLTSMDTTANMPEITSSLKTEQKINSLRNHHNNHGHGHAHAYRSRQGDLSDYLKSKSTFNLHLPPIH